MDDKATPQVLDDLFGELFQGDDIPVAPEARKPAEAAEAFDGVLAPAATLVERCGFARHVKDDAAKLPYVHWYIGIGLFSRTDGGAPLVHKISKPYRTGKGYDFDETQAKIAEVLKADGPPSCESIAGATGGQFCDSCPARLAAEKDGSTFANPLVLARRGMVDGDEAERPKTPADLVAEAEEILVDLAKLSPEEVHGPAIVGALATLYGLDKAKYGQFSTRLPRGTKGSVKEAVVAVAKQRAIDRRNTAVARPDGQGDLPIVTLPGGSSRVIDAAAKFGDLLSKARSMFVRGGAPMRVGRDDEGSTVLMHVKAASLPASLESVARLAQIQDTGSGPQQVSATCSKGTAEIILESREFVEALPPIVALPQCAVLIERGGQLIEVSDYDEESGILAASGPIPEVPLAEAVLLLAEVVADFQFATPADRSRAIAAILTPALIHGDLLGGRAPVDLGEADDSQTGKGYRNRLTAAIYGDQVGTITQRKSGVGGLEESFNQALVAGKVFISLDNVRGKIDSPAIESFLTEPKYFARTPYHPNVEIDTKRVFVMMTSNKAEITRDFANRSSCTKILKQKPGYQFIRYQEGNILQHVQAHQPTYLGAIFAVIRAWHQAGKPCSDESRHDFRRWAQVLDWIVQNILDEAPLMDGHAETQARMANPTKNWLRDVALVVQRASRVDEWLRTHSIVDEIRKVPEVRIPGLKNDGDLDDEATRDRVLLATGRYLSKCFDDGDTIEIDNLRIEKRESPDEEWRTKSEYRFSEGLAETKKCVFPDNPQTPNGPHNDVCEKKIESVGGEEVSFLSAYSTLESPGGIGGKIGNLSESNDGNSQSPEEDKLWI